LFLQAVTTVVGGTARWQEVHSPWTRDPWRTAYRGEVEHPPSLDTPPPELLDSGRMIRTDLHTLQTNDSLTVVAA
jgi:hypothetical protein